MLNPLALYVSFDSLAANKGASVHIREFIQAIKGVYPSRLITLSDSQEDRVFNSYKENFEHLEFATSNEGFWQRVRTFQDKLTTHLKENNYQVIQFRSIWEGYAILKTLKNQTKLIYEVNGFPSIELVYLYPNINKNLLIELRKQELILLLKADKIITPSNVTKHYIISLGIMPNKVQVIPNGVNVDIFQPKIRENRDKQINLIYIGTLAPWQGIDCLLQAIVELLDKDLAVKLKIVGTHRKIWFKYYRQLVQDQALDSKVEFVTACSHQDIVEHLAWADIAVAPLRADERNLVQGCSPIKLFEYAACAKAIIAADLPVVREVFTPEQEVLLYQAEDPQALAAQIYKLASNEILQDALAKSARNLVTKKYTWQQSQMALLNLYKELLNN